jgi:hypothetical protein
VPVVALGREVLRELLKGGGAWGSGAGEICCMRGGGGEGGVRR